MRSLVRFLNLLPLIVGLPLIASTACSAQLIQVSDGAAPVLRPIPKATAKRERAAERFLGWKYAALAKQDTSRWIRKGPVANSQPEIQGPVVRRMLTSDSIPSATSAGYPSFASAALLPTGYLPTGVIDGDFNGDGKRDLAISNGGDNTIYVYLGKGDGTFSVPEVLYTTGQSPVWLAAAQLRSGGPLDLIAVDADSNQVEVFPGNGDGTFQKGKIVATLAQTPTFVLPGDFNKDGYTDLAIGLVIDPLATQSQFGVLLGDGTGSFTSTLAPPPVSNNSESPLATSWMAVGDVNNDGYPDVVATIAYGGAIAYVNQGGTSFKQGQIFNPSDTAVAVGLGDMDGDGCLDAVEVGTYGWLSIAKGNCDGTFTQNGPTAQLGDVAEAVAVADVNGDGKLDVVASSVFSEAEVPAGGNVGAFGGYLVSVLDGDGTGGVGPAQLYRVGPDAFSLAVSNLNGSGFPDIVTISQTESRASLLMNDGSGAFGSPSGEAIGYLNGVTDAPIPSSTPQTVDVNGDGRPDVVLIEYGLNATKPSDVTALLSDGTGKLGPPIRSPITVGPKVPYPAFVAGKFRSTSPADLIYVSMYMSPVVAFIPGNGDGTFGTPVTLASLPDPRQIVAGDFNGDGKLDFAVLGYSGGGFTTTSELDIFLGNGDGSFRQLPAQTFPTPTTAQPQQLIVGDFNHDGKLDLLIGYNSNGGWVGNGDDLDLMLGNGDGTFQNPTTLMSHFGPVAVADLNHDGYLDLVQARDPDSSITEQALESGGGVYVPAAVTVYLGGPGATFTKKATYYPPGLQLPSYEPALVGDFNGDGKVDIALPYVEGMIGRPWERRLQILQGNGDGSFTPLGIPYQLPAYDMPVVGGDYRGLGLTDLLDLVGSYSSVNTISAAPATALAITADSTPLTGAQGRATVTLAVPAASDESVDLSSSDPAVSLPTTLTFSAGQSTQSFSFTLGSGFDSSHLLAISASVSGQTATAYFVKPNPNVQPGVVASVGSITPGISSVSLPPGGAVQLFLTLQSIAGYSGNFGQFDCSGLPAGAQCEFAKSSMLLLPGGYSQVAFQISAGSSTPMGNYPLTVSANNSIIAPSVPVTLGIGGFTLSANPTSVQIDGNGSSTTSVTAAFTNGFSQQIELSCTGLPAGATCSAPASPYPSSPSATATIATTSSVAAQDYSFQITGSADGVTQMVPMTLRVSNFTAALKSDSATVAAGSSANFDVELASLNHFSSSSITVSCQSSFDISCSSSPNPASLSDGGTETITLTVTPRGSTATAKKDHTGPWTATLACFALLLIPPKRQRYGAFLAALVFLFLFSGLSACGGGSTGGGGSGKGQTESVAVSVQATVPSGTLQASAGTVTLTVTQ